MAEPLRIPAPTSKSATQRALLLAALAGGKSLLRDPLDCADSLALRTALRQLGVEVQEQPGQWRVQGGQLTVPAAPLDCAEAGTCARFLAALAPLLPGPVELTGSGQLCRRPLEGLAEVMPQLGRAVVWQGQPGHLPCRLERRGTAQGEVSLEARHTSQLLSGLLMVAPRLGGLRLVPRGEVVSRPYVDLTLALIARFGVQVREEAGSFHVPAGRYQPCTCDVEGDWSAGAMLLVAARLLGRPLEVPNLDPCSTQGDRAIAGFLAELDRPGPHSFDLSTCPDLITPLAVACAFARGPCELRNVAHARLKESDRIAASVELLQAVGLTARELADGLYVEPALPGSVLRPAEIDERGDHRVAMAAGLLSLRIPGVRVRRPECVAKSWPGFWQVLETLARP